MIGWHLIPTAVSSKWRIPTSSHQLLAVVVCLIPRCAFRSQYLSATHPCNWLRNQVRSLFRCSVLSFSFGLFFSPFLSEPQTGGESAVRWSMSFRLRNREVKMKSSPVSFRGTRQGGLIDHGALGQNPKCCTVMSNAQRGSDPGLPTPAPCTLQGAWCNQTTIWPRFCLPLPKPGIRLDPRHNLRDLNGSAIDH